MRYTQQKFSFGGRRALTGLEQEILRRPAGTFQAREALRIHAGLREVELSADSSEREDQIDRLARGLS